MVDRHLRSILTFFFPFHYLQAHSPVLRVICLSRKGLQCNHRDSAFSASKYSSTVESAYAGFPYRRAKRSRILTPIRGLLGGPYFHATFREQRNKGQSGPGQKSVIKRKRISEKHNEKCNIKVTESQPLMNQENERWSVGNNKRTAPFRSSNKVHKIDEKGEMAGWLPRISSTSHGLASSPQSGLQQQTFPF